jgi:hypothetical protein
MDTKLRLINFEAYSYRQTCKHSKWERERERVHQTTAGGRGGGVDPEAVMAEWMAKFPGAAVMAMVVEVVMEAAAWSRAQR